MIFSGDLADKVLNGTKTQTRRPVKGDAPCRCVPGRTYSIQRKRGQAGLGPRILVLSVDRVPVVPISAADAIAEGFDSWGGFAERWMSFYGDTSGECWRIEFELAPPTPERQRATVSVEKKPRYAVRLKAGLVTHWQDAPLLTREEALACLDAIEEHTGEFGSIEEVILSV